MLWQILIGLSGVLGVVLTYLIMSRRVRLARSGLEDAVMQLELEFKKKKELLARLRDITSGLQPKEEVFQRQRNLSNLEEEVRSCQGRVAIAEGELTAVEERLMELKEIEKELENSQVEAGRELEELRTQEKAIREQNESLSKALEEASERIDKLLSELSTSAVAVERLHKAKASLTSMQDQITHYEEEILQVNSQYSRLKRAYDALDIEYAQLYEKHSRY